MRLWDSWLKEGGFNVRCLADAVRSAARPRVFFLVLLGSLLVSGGLVGAAGSVVLDIADLNQDVTIFGANAKDFLTDFNSIAVGDLNGDGLGDLILGDPAADVEEGNRRDAGKVYVIFGRAGFEAVYDLAKSHADIIVQGARPGDQLGSSVAVGDVNGDGRLDLIIGAMGADGPDGVEPRRRDAGAVYVIYGRPTHNKIYDIFDGDQDLTIHGERPGDRLGFSVASGDLNGDSIPDLIIGAVDADGARNDKPNSGHVYVIFGSTSLPRTIDLARRNADFTLYGRNELDQLGNALVIGDVNGDGFDDLIVAAHQADGPGNGRNNSGEVYIIFGQATLPASLELAKKSPDVHIYGANPGDALGVSLALGDVDGDGTLDVVIGAPGHDGVKNARPDAGAVYLLFGGAALSGVVDLALGRADVIIYGADPGDRLGRAVSAGRVGGPTFDDIYADLVLGADSADGPENRRLNAGEAYLILGQNPMPRVIDLRDRDAPIAALFYGRRADDRLGSAAIAGDLDGDGLAEVILGALNADGPENLRTDSGEAYIFYGSRFGPANQPPIADAGPDRTVRVGETVTLDGSRSRDPEGQPLRYQWRIVTSPEGSTATLSGAETVRATFVPDVAGVYILELVVRDTGGATGVDQVQITAEEPPPPPPTRRKGDVDNDGDVDLIDAKLAAEFIVGLRDLDAPSRWAADVREPCQPSAGSAENIDVTDVRWIAEFTIGVRTEMFCLQNPIPTSALSGVALRRAQPQIITLTSSSGRTRAIEFSVGRLPAGATLAIEIFDLQGRRVYQDESQSKRLRWSLQRSSGELAANGVYLVALYVRTADGTVLIRQMNKFVVRR